MDRSDNNKSRVLLIGGTSHTGKSTLAQAVATRLNWQHQSTDKLARHPGRPWSVGSEPISGEVAEHYLSLDVEELVADVLRHVEIDWQKAADQCSQGLKIFGQVKYEWRCAVPLPSWEI